MPFCSRMGPKGLEFETIRRGEKYFGTDGSGRRIRNILAIVESVVGIVWATYKLFCKKNKKILNKGGTKLCQEETEQVH